MDDNWSPAAIFASPAGNIARSCDRYRTGAQCPFLSLKTIKTCSPRREVATSEQLGRHARKTVGGVLVWYVSISLVAGVKQWTTFEFGTNKSWYCAKP